MWLSWSAIILDNIQVDDYNSRRRPGFMRRPVRVQRDWWLCYSKADDQSMVDVILQQIIVERQDSFHTFKIKITNTPHLIVPTSTLEVTQKHDFHPHKNNLIILTWLFILQKEYGLCERKRKSIRAQKHRKRKKRKKKKDSPYLKIKDRVM